MQSELYISEYDEVEEKYKSWIMHVHFINSPSIPSIKFIVNCQSQFDS